MTGARSSRPFSRARVIFSPTTEPMLPPMNLNSMAQMITGLPPMVPLALAGVGVHIEPGVGPVVDEPVRTIDLFPTLFDAMGLQGPSGVDGSSRLPLLRGEDQPLDVFAETDYRLFVHRRMIRQGDWKLTLDLQDGERKLYHLPDDPDEQNDLSSSEPRRTYEMEQALRTWMAATRTNPQDYLGLKQKPIEIF